MEVGRQVEACRPETPSVDEGVIEMRICHKALDCKPVTSDRDVSYVDRDCVICSHLHKIAYIQRKMASEGRIAAQSAWKNVHHLSAERRFLTEFPLPHGGESESLGPGESRNISVAVQISHRGEHIIVLDAAQRSDFGTDSPTGIDLGVCDRKHGITSQGGCHALHYLLLSLDDSGKRIRTSCQTALCRLTAFHHDGACVEYIVADGI